MSEQTPINSAAPKSASGYVLLGVGLVLVLSLIIGSCAQRGDANSSRATADAHERGLAAAKSTAKILGESEGYKAAHDVAYRAAYEETAASMLKSLKYKRMHHYLIATLLGFAALGFLTQWLLFYLARVVGMLTDVDAILLPSEQTVAELSDPSASARSSGAGLPIVVLLITLIAAGGCTSAEDAAWSAAYESAKHVGYHDGWGAGYRKGQKDGELEGAAAATAEVSAGTAWLLYSPVATWAFLAGSAIGVFLQYVTLYSCQASGSFSEVWTVLLVPGMRHSAAYAALRRKREHLSWFSSELEKVSSRKKIKLAQIRAVSEVATRELEAVQNIDQLSQARIIEIVRTEIENIAGPDTPHPGAPHAERTQQSQATPTHRRDVTLNWVCPHCGGRIRYHRKYAGLTKKCPYAKCGQSVRYPNFK